ncbi:hypothetical protein QQX85_09175 [Klebsiella variicola]|uniref:hypothetical protein n=1 Tax=Klebsiella variicola TaxID=244366 RepID=UPI00225B7764
MRYAHPGQPGALVSFKSAYGNFIDGKFVEPLSGCSARKILILIPKNIDTNKTRKK